MITLQKKQALIDSAKQHQKLDEYQTGIFFKNGKGCAVGCAIADINRLENLDIDHDDHRALAEYLDVPLFLTKMQDNIFEYCTDDYRKNWPIKFLEAIPTDRTISDLIMPKFLLFALKDSDYKDVKDVLTNWIETGKPDKEAADSAAWDTDAWYTDAGYTDAWRAANAALYAALCVAARADACVVADDVAACAAYPAAADEAKIYDSYGDELLRLMNEIV